MKKIFLLFFALIVIFSFVLSGCRSSASPVTAAGVSDSQEIVSRIVSAMSQVDTFQLSTKVENSYGLNSGGQSINVTNTWSSTKQALISQNEMSIEMDIDSSYPETAKNTTSLDIYLADGWQYLQYLSSPLLLQSPSGGQNNPWQKEKLSDETWNAETQIPAYIELLQTATSSDLSGDEKLNGVDCFVLHLTPSSQALVDWILSQRQPAGPRIDYSLSGVELSRPEVYQGGSVTLWIDKADKLILQAEIQAEFSGSSSDGLFGSNFNSPTATPANTQYSGQATFSDYNQPVSIQVPQEALDETENK